jgi:hypothetical protein
MNEEMEATMRAAAVLVASLLSGMLACSQNAREPDAPGSATLSNEETTGVLSRALSANKKASDLELLAIAACKSRNGRDVDELTRLLLDAKFLANLEEEGDDPRVPPEKIPWPGARLGGILRSLARNHPAKAEKAFLGLGKDKRFMGENTRVEALMRACGEFKDPSKEVLDFLESQAAPRTWQNNIVDGILAKMGSAGALERIRKRMAVPQLNVGRDVFQDILIEQRDRWEVIGLYRGVIEDGLKDAETRNMVVQTLFDYRPGWYGVRCGPEVRWPKPPDRRGASSEILGELVKIADLTAKLDLTDETRQSVAKGRKEIEEIIDFRKSGKPELIAKHIKNLDSPSFQERDKATRELKQFGDWAEPQLRKALEASPTPEARSRIDMILREIAEAKKKKGRSE